MTGLRSRLGLLLLLLSGLAACDRAPAPVRFHAQGQPALLSEWGVLQVADRRLRLNQGVVPYELNTPLFSDYAHKLRTVWMPEGTSARYKADGAFEFPVGTVVSKTFYYPRVPGQAADSEVVARSNSADGEFRDGALDLAKVRLIETRLLVRRQEGWIALPYVWNAEQTEAKLMRGGELVALSLQAADGSRESATYQVPDQNQCGGCHGTDIKSKALQPIGLKARHLNREFDYAGGRANQLAHWQRLNYLSELPAQADLPHAADWRDSARASLDARARAYLDINCGHCHSPKPVAGCGHRRAAAAGPLQAADRGRQGHRRPPPRHRAGRSGRVDPGLPHGQRRPLGDDAGGRSQRGASRRRDADPGMDRGAAGRLRLASGEARAAGEGDGRVRGERVVHVENEREERSDALA